VIVTRIELWDIFPLVEFIWENFILCFGDSQTFRR